MPRKAFIEDLEKVKDTEIAGVYDVQKGKEDGNFSFGFIDPSAAIDEPIHINVLPTDISGYPKHNTYFLFTEEENVPKPMTTTIDFLNQSTEGMNIEELLRHCSKKLYKALSPNSAAEVHFDDEDEFPHDADADADNDDDEEEEEEEEDHHYDSDSDNDFDGWPTGSPSNTFSKNVSHHHLSADAITEVDNQIKKQLRTAKFAGFRIGVLCGMKAESNGSMICVSIRISKLGLSAEAIQAWELNRDHYIVLLIRYNGSYRSFQDIVDAPVQYAGVEFRVGVSHNYKPKYNEALAAFISSKGILNEKPSHSTDDAKGGKQSFKSFFLSSSINQFMNEQFISLLKIRHAQSLDWDGAKRFYMKQQGRPAAQSDTEPGSALPDTPLLDRMETVSTDDHLSEAGNVENCSLPLIAMQFALRYIAQCTKYCLVCHNKMEETFEALKPYVCSNPLCLFQYMQLGFGTSIEHEILTQPYVVDLLISFCYTAAASQKLREYPVGMNLRVPTFSVPVQPVQQNRYFNPTPLPGSPDIPSTATPPKMTYHAVKYHPASNEAIVTSSEYCKLHPGDWVCIKTFDGLRHFHKVQSISHPNIKFVKPIPLEDTKPPSARSKPTTSLDVLYGTVAASQPVVDYKGNSADMYIYDENFDELDELYQCASIVTLLESLPPISQMRKYLLKASITSEARLQDWNDRISPSALGLLRWIVASNRSSIVYVGGSSQIDKLDSNSQTRSSEKVTNMDGWVQFRLAQGAPDKEQRFHQALLQKSSTLDSSHPTLFAWHGSHLFNWHSIIRSGLDFKEVQNARAFGHGCYHSQDFNTSLGYSGGGVLYSGFHSRIWPNSELKPFSAICLNEIINAPNEYVSKSPHLVVQHVDWIQCRYLFIKLNENASSMLTNEVQPVAPTPKVASSQEPIEVIQQDPKMSCQGPVGTIGIPLSAFPAARAFRSSIKVGKDRGKRQKTRAGSLASGSSSEVEITESDDDDPQDIAFLCEDVETLGLQGKGKGIELLPTKPLIPMIDFVSGSLDRSSIKLLAPPSYATSSATKTLNRELKTILKIQESTPLHELGWYIDGDLITNMYQWIVELHSFESSLPLAQDMKSAGLTSVVLELRFGSNFPISPPFVRVIRPRFLPFMNGGGGHVTAGGAMCMELLTNSGWTAVSSIEGVLLQVRMAISNLEPRPARLERIGAPQVDYGISEAINAYMRACQAHGWEVPAGLMEFNYDAHGSGVWPGMGM